MSGERDRETSREIERQVEIERDRERRWVVGAHSVHAGGEQEVGEGEVSVEDVV